MDHILVDLVKVNITLLRTMLHLLEFRRPSLCSSSSKGNELKHQDEIVHGK
jgi:hypothetical protein